MRITVKELRELKEMFSFETKTSTGITLPTAPLTSGFVYTPLKYQTITANDANMTVPDAKAEDLVKPMSVLDDLTPEEILMYHSPRFDEIQAEKAAHREKLAEELSKK